jgi:hypothetical protein
MLLQTGLGGLAAYLAAHVLLCLLPAFFIAGALAALIPKEAVTRFLGKDTPKWISYPMAAVGGFTLAVCSCTIMPLFAGIYKKGAGLGPAITFLFVGPAVNIMAISFTGVQIGMDIAIARVVLSLLFGVLIGLIMAKTFEKDDEAHNQQTNKSNLFAGQAKVPAHISLFLAVLLGTLIAGTLQVGLLTNAYLQFTLPAPWATGFQAWLDALVPANPAFGVEGISVHGVALIALLVAISVAAVKGFNNVYEGLNRWTYTAMGLIAATLFVAALRVELAEGSLMVGITGKFFALLILLALLARLAKRFEISEMGDWLWETWRFVKQIIPLLLVGVFVAGMAARLIPPGWIQAIAGSNTVGANLAGVLFGVFMYFPTLVEVPVAQTFLSLGMQRGPLLAYLLADPVLSLQSILITRSIIGGKKMFLYVTLITVFSTLAGLLFGLTVK